MQDTVNKKIKKVLVGKVIKLSSANTIKVRVETKKMHEMYNKVIKSHKNYLVHVAGDEEIKVGDEVKITDTRPMSKSKSWIYLSKVN